MCPWGGTLKGAELRVCLESGACYGAGGDNCLVKIHWVPTESAIVVPQGFSEEVTFELKPK